MELLFWWDDAYFGALRPRCEGANGQGRLLAGLLTDDGGIGHEATLTWLDVGIGMARDVRLGRRETGHWARESLDARIGSEGVRIAWLLHEDEVEFVSLARFEHALSAWRGFLAAGPAASRSERIALPLDP